MRQSASEEEEHTDDDSDAAVFEVVDADATLHLHPDEEEADGCIEAPNAIRDALSQTYFEKMVGSPKECIVNRVKDTNNKSDKTHIDLTCSSGPNIVKHVTVNDVWVVIDKHWSDLCKEQDIDYLHSDLFKSVMLLHHYVIKVIYY